MPSGVFYDDFALLEPSGGATLASMAAENLLELLGWKYATEGSKASKFEPCFNLLGAQLDLASLHEGFVKVSNKPSRLVKLKELLAAMKQNRRISKSEAQSMHGLLNYASGFFLGQSLKTASRAFANLVARPMVLMVTRWRSFATSHMQYLRSQNPDPGTAGWTTGPL